jgi:hypothetical protein
MQCSSGPAASLAPTLPGPNQRTHYRHPIHSLVYVTLDQGNGGIIRNLSQGGAAIQAVAALHPNESIRMRFELLHPKTRVDVHAQVAWANASGQAGLRFLDMLPRSRRPLNDWIFSNLLRIIEQAFPVLAPEETDDLVLSASARPAIRLPGPRPTEGRLEKTVTLPGWPSPISSRTLAQCMDGLILLSAVLMFLCVFLGLAHTLPAWPVALGLMVGVGGFFTLLYWYLFAVLGCGTAGVRLVRMAIADSESERMLREAEARFR